MTAAPIIVVVNRKGGVGKTTVATHLAAALALHGQNVGIIDTDPQGHVAPSLGILPKDDLYHLSALPASNLAHHVTAVPTERYAPPGNRTGALSVITGGKQTSAITSLDSYSPFDFADLTGAYISSCHLDALVIDTAPTYNLFDAAIMFAATHVLYVTEATYLSLDGLQQSINEIVDTDAQFAQYRGYNVKFLGIVPNKTTLRTVVQRKQLSDMLSALPDFTVWNPIPLSALWQEASAYSLTVFAYAPESKEATLAHQLATQCLDNL